jgi:dienelactone hydrolase
MGERVAEIAALSDYIRLNESVGARQVGAMGNSLGGTLAIYSAATHEGIGFAVASSCVSSFRESIFRIYHCPDLYIPKMLQYLEFGDIIGLAAPKPMLLVHGLNDQIFPITGFRSAYRQSKKIYAAANAKNQLKVVLGLGAHRFYGELAKHTFRLMMSRSLG